MEWVQRPVKAVLMLFPITEGYEKMRKEQDARVEEDGVEGVEDVLFFKQTSTLTFSIYQHLRGN